MSATSLEDTSIETAVSSTPLEDASLETAVASIETETSASERRGSSIGAAVGRGAFAQPATRYSVRSA